MSISTKRNVTTPTYMSITLIGTFSSTVIPLSKLPYIILQALVAAYLLAYGRSRLIRKVAMKVNRVKDARMAMPFV